MRKTKIVATLGPATAEDDVLAKLIAAGVDVVRLNFSHGTHEGHAQSFARVKAEALRQKKHVAVFGDLCGPKIRTGDLKDGLFLSAGDEVVLVPEGHSGGIGITNEECFTDVQVGEPVMLDDGYLAFEVIRKERDKLICRVVTGGRLKSHKGVNFPSTTLSLCALTQKDREDAYFGLDLGLDFFALSFVQTPEDVMELKQICGRTGVIAKIERPVALANLDGILSVADGFMVARGDLGVERGFEHVPAIQKRLIREARLRAKPVITATQMLESMIQNPTPTRAEVSDVANAVLDGTSAVMLSAETAAGQHPIEAVRMMTRIIDAVEGDSYFETVPLPFPAATTFTQAIANAAVSAIGNLDVRLIAVFSQTGETARELSKFHPRVPVVALTSRLEVLACMSLEWGVVPLYCPALSTPAEMVQSCQALLLENGLVRPGDRIAISLGFEVDGPGRTNTLKLHVIG
jgi:pyruvate kinase